MAVGFDFRIPPPPARQSDSISESPASTFHFRISRQHGSRIPFPNPPRQHGSRIPFPNPPRQHGSRMRLPPDSPWPKVAAVRDISHERTPHARDRARSPRAVFAARAHHAIALPPPTTVLLFGLVHQPVHRLGVSRRNLPGDPLARRESQSPPFIEALTNGRVGEHGLLFYGQSRDAGRAPRKRPRKRPELGVRRDELQDARILSPSLRTCCIL